MFKEYVYLRLYMRIRVQEELYFLYVCYGLFNFCIMINKKMNKRVSQLAVSLLERICETEFVLGFFWEGFWVQSRISRLKLVVSEGVYRCVCRGSFS